MPDFQIDARSNRRIRVGRGGEVVATFAPGRFIADQKGEVAGEPCTMKLPAPWRGMRFRLEQGGRELASAKRPKYFRGVVIWELEMPGRRLELVSQEEHGLEFQITEGGDEFGRFRQREFGEQDEWTADLQLREDLPALAAFVAWLVLEARGMLQG